MERLIKGTNSNVISVAEFNRHTEAMPHTQQPNEFPINSQDMNEILISEITESQRDAALEDLEDFPTQPGSRGAANPEDTEPEDSPPPSPFLQATAKHSGKRSLVGVRPAKGLPRQYRLNPVRRLKRRLEDDFYSDDDDAFRIVPLTRKSAEKQRLFRNYKKKSTPVPRAQLAMPAAPKKPPPKPRTKRVRFQPKLGSPQPSTSAQARAEVQSTLSRFEMTKNAYKGKTSVGPIASRQPVSGYK